MGISGAGIPDHMPDEVAEVKEATWRFSKLRGCKPQLLALTDAGAGCWCWLLCAAVIIKIEVKHVH